MLERVGRSRPFSKFLPVEVLWLYRSGQPLRVGEVRIGLQQQTHLVSVRAYKCEESGRGNAPAGREGRARRPG